MTEDQARATQLALSVLREMMAIPALKDAMIQNAAARNPGKVIATPSLAEIDGALESLYADPPAEKPPLQYPTGNFHVFHVIGLAIRNAKLAGWTDGQILAYLAAVNFGINDAKGNNLVLRGTRKWFKVEE